MKEIRKLIFVTLLLGTSVFGQNTDVIRDESQQDILKREVSLSNIPSETPVHFGRAIHNAQLPGGVVLVNCADLRESYVFSVRNISLRKVFAVLDRADPQYTTQWRDGVLNLLPRQDLPQLLDTQIKEFEVSNVTALEALAVLREKPEVVKKMNELGLDKAVTSLTMPQYFDPDGKPEKARHFNLFLENTTFQQILNEIVKLNGRSTWIYEERHCEETRFSITLSEY